MQVLLPIVVVNVRRADAALQQAIRGFHAFVHVRVAHVQANVQIQMRGAQEHEQPLGARQRVGSIFEQHFHAALAGEQH